MTVDCDGDDADEHVAAAVVGGAAEDEAGGVVGARDPLYCHSRPCRWSPR